MDVVGEGRVLRCEVVGEGRPSHDHPAIEHRERNQVDQVDQEAKVGHRHHEMRTRGQPEPVHRQRRPGMPLSIPHLRRGWVLSLSRGLPIVFVFSVFTSFPRSFISPMEDMN